MKGYEHYRERGATKGAAARAQTQRKRKIKLTLPPHSWAPPPEPVVEEAPPKRPPRTPGPKWDRALK